MTPRSSRTQIIITVVAVELLIVFSLLVYQVWNSSENPSSRLAANSAPGLTVVSQAETADYRGEVSQVAQVVHATEDSGKIEKAGDSTGGSTNHSIASSTNAKILFVGDMMFDRYIRQVNNAKGSDFLFSCINPLLKSVDFTVGNLEGPITQNVSVSAGTKIGSPLNYRFTFPAETARTLSAHNIKIVNLGNNHISNYGRTGIIATKKYLSDAGVFYFGGLIGESTVYRTTDAGIELSFVSYNQFGGDTIDTVALEIAQEKANGRVVIVYAHWGQEYSEDISQIRSIATVFAKNGADVIIGSHPHIVLPHEYIGKTLVYYSLGNFIFDQYFDSRVLKGLAVQLDISNKGINAREYPLVLYRDGRTCHDY